MMKNEQFQAILFALLLVALVCVMIWFNEKRNDCEARGGLLIKADFGYECISKGALK